MSATEDRRAGQASIKAEFRKERWFDDDNNDYNGGADADDAAEGDKPQDTEKRRFDKAKSKAERGMNRGDRGKRRLEDKIKKKAANLAKPAASPMTCKLTWHPNLQTWVIDASTLIFSESKCSYGYKCRYLKAHLDENNKLVTNEEQVSNTKPTFTLNGIKPDFQFMNVSLAQLLKISSSFNVDG
ncbi:hypothetical protein DM01DRAFT_321734 [Hesseltinella vesiculosa]|uniref:Uncharacterized protein n=1 Tax=Hesseltinella vesiculosa TaxID=101127 RepID=A0A1X2GBQ2_9FUNG|nr:hypothetical protein DM01DRAFT_321734 [Hesseltinella vesiculosa]